LRWLQQHVLLLFLLVFVVLLVVVGVVVVIVVVVVAVASIVLWRRLTGTATTSTVHGLHFSRIRVYVCMYICVSVCLYARRWRREGTRCRERKTAAVGGWMLESASKILYYTFIFNLLATRRCCMLLLLLPFAVPFWHRAFSLTLLPL